MKHGCRRFDFDKGPPAHWCWRHGENGGLCFQKGVVRTFAVVGASICRNPDCRRHQDLGLAPFDFWWSKMGPSYLRLFSEFPSWLVWGIVLSRPRLTRASCRTRKVELPDNP